jgi:hypothetical protein
MVPVEPVTFAGPWRGLLRRRRALDHPMSYAAESRNVELFGNALAKRQGTKRISTTQLGDGSSRRVHALFQAKWRAGTGTDEVLAAAGALLQAVGDPPSADRYNLAYLPSGSPARSNPTNPVYFAQFDNKVFLVDGTNALNLKYTYIGGTGRFQKFGISAPSAAPSVGAPTGTGITLATGRKYRQTYVNSITQHESEPGPESASTGAVANKTIPVTTSASPDPQVDRVRVYATTDGGGGSWLFVGEVNDGSVLNDAVPDASLGTALQEFVNDPPPDVMRLVVPWPSQGRMLGVAEASPSILRVTDLVIGRLKPESWPPENIVFVNVDAGDDIVGLYPYSDSVLIFCRRSVWRMQGTYPAVTLEPVQFDPRRTAVGSFGQHAIVQVDDVLLSPFLDGAYSVGRFEDLKGGFTSSRISREIDDLWIERNPAVVRRSHAIFHRSRKQLRWFIPHGSNGEPTRCLVYQLDVVVDGDAPGGWGLWEVLTPTGTPAQVTASVVVETATGDVTYIGTVDGYVLQMDQGFEDSWSGASPGNGAAYEFVWETVPFQGEDESPRRLRMVDVVIRPETVCDVGLTPKTDFTMDWTGVVFSFTPAGVFILGSSMLDVGALGSVTPASRRAVLLSRGTHHALRFRNDQKGASFAIERWVARWQPLAWKAVGADEVQAR